MAVSVRAAHAAFVAALVALLPTARGVSATGRPPSRQTDRAAQLYLDFSVGTLLELQGLLADALVHYRRADANKPGHCVIETAIARVLNAAGRTQEARESLETVHARCPESLETTLLLAQITLAGGDPAAAEALVSERAPSGPADLLVLLTQALVAQGRHAEALELYRGRASVDSLSPRIAFYYARALLSAGQLEESVRQLERAHRLDPENKAVLAMLGRMQIALGRPADGVRVLEQLTASTDALEPEYLALASGYSKLGRHDEAKEVLASAAAAFGETAALLRALGEIHFSTGETREALSIYERSLSLEPDSVEALNFLAYTLADESIDLERALTYATRAAELAPENGPVRDTLGWTYYRLGRFEEAVRELEQAVRLAGDDGVLLEHLGDALNAAGRREDAVLVWERALAAEPGRASTRERLEAVDGRARIPSESRGTRQ